MPFLLSTSSSSQLHRQAKPLLLQLLSPTPCFCPSRFLLQSYAVISFYFSLYCGSLKMYESSVARSRGLYQHNSKPITSSTPTSIMCIRNSLPVVLLSLLSIQFPEHSSFLLLRLHYSVWVHTISSVNFKLIIARSPSQAISAPSQPTLASVHRGSLCKATRSFPFISLLHTRKYSGSRYYCMSRRLPLIYSLKSRGLLPAQLQVNHNFNSKLITAPVPSHYSTKSQSNPIQHFDMSVIHRAIFSWILSLERLCH